MEPRHVSKRQMPCCGRRLGGDSVGEGPTVDGRNPSNHLIGSLSQYLQGFRHPGWLAGFLPSTV